MQLIINAICSSAIWLLLKSDNFFLKLCDRNYNPGIAFWLHLHISSNNPCPAQTLHYILHMYNDSDSYPDILSKTGLDLEPNCELMFFYSEVDECLLVTLTDFNTGSSPTLQLIVQWGKWFAEQAYTKEAKIVLDIKCMNHISCFLLKKNCILNKW